MEDSITTKRILENGYERDWESCYRYLDIRHLSLDELVNSWNELTINTKKDFDNVVKQNQEYKEEIKEKKDDALREVLKGRKSGTVIKKQSSTTNGFEVLANRASQ